MVRVKLIKKSYVKKGKTYENYYIYFPIEIVRRLKLKEGMELEVYVEDTGKIVIVPVKQ